MKFAGPFRAATLLVCCVASFANADVITLQPVADTTLVETEPNNNVGGTFFVNAGTSGIGTKNRGLYRFDFSSIPQGSTITSVSLLLEVVKEPSAGAVPSLFSLHRMLKPWGEGDKDSSFEVNSGFGYPAETNEATWNSPFAFTSNNWSAPGASGDFIETASSSAMVYQIGDFPEFSSTPEMVADVQAWLDNPEANSGWLLKTEEEVMFRTARGFGSRENTVNEEGTVDTNSPPILTIEFNPPLTISHAKLQEGKFQFSFLANAERNYVVEFRNAFDATNSWQTLTNISAQASVTNISISDELSSNTRFYRIVVP